MYTGEYKYGLKDGCGEVRNLGPYLREVQSGIDPFKAWITNAEKINKDKKPGIWKDDRYDKYNSCTPTEINSVLNEAEEAANKARLFRYKPDGMAQIFYQDARGCPVRTLQDPLHYPYGTIFLAPGPISQLFPLPDDDGIKHDMRKAQNLWRNIYDKYNFDPNPDHDSTFAYALNLWADSKYWQIKDMIN